MADQDRAGTEQGNVVTPVPVTPSAGTERPEGLAFDVEKGADLSGVPAGDQRPANPGASRTEQVVRETGHGVGLAVPPDADQDAEKPRDGETGAS
jgi:hypothetical protein